MNKLFLLLLSVFSVNSYLIDYCKQNNEQAVESISEEKPIISKFEERKKSFGKSKKPSFYGDEDNYENNCNSHIDHHSRTNDRPWLATSVFEKN